MFQQYLSKERPEAGEDSALKIVKKCNEICRLVFESCKDKLERKFGCFELFGLDFLVNDELNPVLIEINTNPAMFTDTQVQKDMLPKLVDDTIKLALQLHPVGQTDAASQLKELDLSKLQLKYDVIYQ